MRTNLNRLCTGLFSILLLTGCGGEEEKKKEASGSALGAASAWKNIADQAKEMGKNGTAKTVDFRSLKELLPSDLEGLTRQEATGEKNGAVGFTVSTATGKYANSNNSETIEITLVDGGGSVVTMGLAAWSMVEVDKETENGYEKTSQIGNNKSYEKYDNASQEGEIAVLVNKRFLVTVDGKGVSMEKIKAALEAIDLPKLAALK